MKAVQVGCFLLYSGIGIIMSVLIYMIINLSDADKFISTWMMCMIVGVLSTFWGAIVLFINKKEEESSSF